jgi:hypothetical protein
MYFTVSLQTDVSSLAMDRIARKIQVGNLLSLLNFRKALLTIKVSGSNIPMKRWN